MGVDFYRDYFVGAFQQRFGEGAFAGADLDDSGDALAAGGFGDAIQNGFAGEEVLAEASAQLRVLSLKKEFSRKGAKLAKNTRNAQPFTSTSLLRKKRRSFPDLAWPNCVTGSKVVKIRRFSRLLRICALVRTLKPLTTL